MKPITIPPQLQNDRFRFVILKKNQKRPDGLWKEKANHLKYDDPRLLKHLASGGGYGVLGGYGELIIFDVDNKKAIPAFYDLPETFTVKSAGKGMPHLYFTCKDQVPFQTINDPDDPEGKEHLLEVRSDSGHQTVGPGTIIAGKTYTIFNNLPIAEVSKAKLDEVVRKVSEVNRVEEEKSELTFDRLLDLSQFTFDGREYYGPHPVHESRSGTNFWINPEKNVWNCWRCGSGGGPISLAAVLNKIIKCDQAKKGGLRGELFIKTLEVIEKKYKVKILKIQQKGKEQPRRESDLIENTIDIEFPGLDEILQGERTHLVNHDIIDDVFPLQGEEYVYIKKSLNYTLNSILQPAFSFRVGRYYFDNRKNDLIFSQPGRGKGIIKNGLKRYSPSTVKVGEITTISHHEQLLGKMVKGDECPGILRKDALLVDECSSMLNEIDVVNSEIMRKMRIAMDAFGFNQVSKDLTADKETLEYCPTTRFVSFSHPVKLNPKFISSGTFRRYFAFEVEYQRSYNLEDSTKGLLENPGVGEDEIRRRLQEQQEGYRTLPSPSFPIDVVREIKGWIDSWNYYVLTHPNPHVQKFGEDTFFSIKEYFFRLIAIHAISRGEIEVSIETAKEACRDCVELLLQTIRTYGKRASFLLGSDVWETEDYQEALLLRWMFREGAITRERTHLSISDVQGAIENVFGIKGRQAISRYGEMKSRGLIHDAKGKDTSFCWLGFRPKLREPGSQEVQDLQWGTPPVNLPERVRGVSLRAQIKKNKNKKIIDRYPPSTTAPLAPLRGGIAPLAPSEEGEDDEPAQIRTRDIDPSNLEVV